MFKKIEIENVGPYNQKIVLDFTINKRNKEKIDSITTLEDGVQISNVVGIISGNACGKSTILESLNYIGSFIGGALRKRTISMIYDEHREELPNNIKKMLEFELSSGCILPPINMEKKGNAKISLDMYIDAEEEFKGYYTYTIEYNDDYKKNGVISERLDFRKKDLSTKIDCLFEVNNNLESEIGYKLAYKENIISELEDKINVEKLNNKLEFYRIFLDKYTDESSSISATDFDYSEDYIIDSISEDKEDINNLHLLEMFAKSIDSQIKSAQIEDEDINKPKLYFYYNKGYKIRYGNLSTATKKICAFTCDFIKSQKKCGVLLADELDNSLNIQTVKTILALYNRNSNKKGQLIFTTNNPEIVNELRRDQIFILIRNEGIIKCGKFSEFVDPITGNKVRSDLSFVKAYKDNTIKNHPNVEAKTELINFINKIY